MTGTNLVLALRCIDKSSPLHTGFQDSLISFSEKDKDGYTESLHRVMEGKQGFF